MGYCKKWNDKHADWMYMLFRLLVGLMFFMHGAGKLFGWFGGPGMGFSGLMEYKADQTSCISTPECLDELVWFQIMPNQ